MGVEVSAPRRATFLPVASSTGVSGSTFRPDIEGLRAIAVVAVVLFHARIGPFDGGFVGVDMFFVVSGFLITSLLIGESAVHGRIDLARFWARRARRLLPASAVVIVTVLVASRFILDPLAQRDVADDAFAATFFVSNFVFAFARSGYFASQLDPSPLLHYWSLSVEEQFYLLWPLLVAAVAAWAPRRHRRVWLGVVIGAIWVFSLTASIRFSGSTEWAFYLLHTRAWELATGAGLALAMVSSGAIVGRIPKQVRASAAWLALVVIAVVVVTYEETMVFPGAAALAPVLATAVLIALCDVRRHVGPSRLLATSPMQWIGARSYSIYLWHWPMLVFAAAQWAGLGVAGRAAVAAASVVVAAASYTWIENPIRHHPGLSADTGRSLRLGGATLAVTGLVAVFAVAFPPDLTGTGVVAAPELVTASTTPGVATTVPAPVPPDDTVTGSRSPQVQTLRAANYAALTDALAADVVPANLEPSLVDVRTDQPEIYADGCHLKVAELEPRECVSGDPSSSTRVLLFGDSHAAMWYPAMSQLAAERGWRLDTATKSGCPTAWISQNNPLRDGRCDTWRAKMVEWVAAERPDLVVMSARAYDELRGDVWTVGLTTTLEQMRPHAGQILILGDTPDQDVDVPACLAERLNSATRCLTPRADGVNTAVLEAERDVAASFDARFEPTTDWVCTLDGCPVIVGNLLLYRDDNHLTTAAARYLQPYLAAVVDEALAVSVG
jgi:peptidoglycan/LPS O-acetylase OafA/YrhL